MRTDALDLSRVDTVVEGDEGRSCLGRVEHINAAVIGNQDLVVGGVKNHAMLIRMNTAVRCQEGPIVRIAAGRLV